MSFNASFILGGQIRGEPPRLFRIYAEGNFIEAGVDTPYIQTGETKYGKPIIDRVIVAATNLADATKCVLVSFDSTMRSNLSVGMPIDLICYERDSLEVRMRRRFEEGDAYFTSLHRELERRHAPGVQAVARARLVSRPSPPCDRDFLVVTCEHGGNRIPAAYASLFRDWQSVSRPTAATTTAR